MVTHEENVLSKPQITYELPLSKVVQAIKSNHKIEHCWPVIQQFLTHCTTAKVDSPERFDLIIHGHKDRDVSKLLQAATKAFGTCETHFDGIFDLSRWQLTQSNLNQAIQFMIDHQPYPTAVRPYIQLRIVYRFCFIDPASQHELDDQSNTSLLAVFLQKNSSVMPEFWFPFEQIEDLKSYLLKIAPYLPFKKIDTKAFRLVSPNKKGTNNIRRKLDLDGFRI
ncbi:hypothetical protein PAECIP112173_00973 [Paenibacillus sp. JJ-100]|uniref:hypothetical protein n=1 Tax=Paenibacillus sp. JJ-100 TaxID=2974896 RepID=UPI0022FFA35C|nr:hypothetical protein [Paenibacillus sp. JJ-100]CAI6040014.1 hypothetical protein PAECIP112173_00973 [Paenibacillus sp. JJ-100]